MDSTARKVLVALVKRLRHEEEMRYRMMAQLGALKEVLGFKNPIFRQAYEDRLATDQETLSQSLADLYAQFDQLLSLLENPDLPETDEQRMLRLLESFEGPKQ